jgi:hypothetical protein
VYHLLGYNPVQSVECQPTFRRNISPPSSGSNNRPSIICIQPHCIFTGSQCGDTPRTPCLFMQKCPFPALGSIDFPLPCEYEMRGSPSVFVRNALMGISGRCYFLGTKSPLFRIRMTNYYSLHLIGHTHL